MASARTNQIFHGRRPEIALPRLLRVQVKGFSVSSKSHFERVTRNDCESLIPGNFVPGRDFSLGYVLSHMGSLSIAAGSI